MARLPDETQINQVSISSRSVRRAPRDFISPAVANLGEKITREADLDQDLQLRVARKAKAEGDALDWARASSDWNTRRLNELDTYDLTKKPKYDQWGKQVETNLPKHRAASAEMIQDPKLRQKFILQTQDDITSATLGVKDKAEAYVTDKRRAEGLAAIDNNLALATRPGISQKESDKIIMQSRASLDNLAMTGVLTPEQTVNARQTFAKKYASLKIAQDIETNPGEAARNLRGGAGDVYYSKLRKQESGGRDNAKAGTSSATGRYQFIESTWNEVRKNHPELALTADGRTDPSQQERAIRVFTADNGRALEAAGLPQSEANLYLAHFMGAGGAIQALKADPNATAASLFPESASANRTIFYTSDGAPRTVGEVIALQTKNFSGQNGPAPDYYQLVEPDDRLRLASAAEGEWARREKADTEATALDKYSMDQKTDNDIAQIAETGQSTNLTVDEVRTTLGDTGTAKWLEERETAVQTYKAVSVLDGMDPDQVTEHLDSLRPSAGDSDFKRKNKIYDAAEKKWNSLEKLRLNDPAKAVEDSPIVKKAMEGLNPDDPTTIQALVKARLAAQQNVKIPVAMQQPIDRMEARKIIAPIQSVMDMMDATVIAATGEGKGDAATRRQAAKDASKNAEMVIKQTVDQIEQTYGPYAPKVLAFAIAESVRDKEIGNVASVMYRKLAKGEKPTIGDMRSLETVSEASIAEKAIKGELKPPQAQKSTGQQRIEQVKKSQEANKVWPQPSQRAVDFLNANPQSAADFEKNFGAGSAARWLPRN